jgi:hypothetical protein
MEKETRGPGPKSRQANSPKKAGHRKKNVPLRTEPSTRHMKHRLKRREVNPIKLQA